MAYAKDQEFVDVIANAAVTAAVEDLGAHMLTKLTPTTEIVQITAENKAGLTNDWYAFDGTCDHAKALNLVAAGRLIINPDDVENLDLAELTATDGAGKCIYAFLSQFRKWYNDLAADAKPANVTAFLSSIPDDTAGVLTRSITFQFKLDMADLDVKAEA